MGIIHLSLSKEVISDMSRALIIAMQELDKYDNSADKKLSDRIELILAEIQERHLLSEPNGDITEIRS